MPRPAAVASLLLLAALPLDAAAQRRDRDPGPVRVHGGLALEYVQPVGEFGDQVDEGWGFGGEFLYRVDDEGVFGIRLDGAYVNYGRETRAVLLSPTVGGRITVDLETTNDILLFGAGPQLMLPGRTVRPYLNLTGGVAYFVTQSSLQGDLGDDRFGQTNNFDDLVFSFGGGAGVYVPISRGRTPIALDLGAQYRRNADVRYLREGSIVDNPDGTVSFEPIRSDADLLVYRLGVSVGLRRPDREGRRGR